jgi:hypothetical protein
MKSRRRVNSTVRRHHMSSAVEPPSLEEFKITCREAFAFVTAHGFDEVAAQRTTNPFQVWFRRHEEFIVIEGESWGTIASGFIEHISGVELAIIYLVPPEARPPKRKRRKRQPSQLEQIREQASWLQSHAEDFLRGDLQRFFNLATSPPRWKKRLSNGT